MSATSTRSTIRSARARGISWCISTTTRAVPAASMTAAGYARWPSAWSSRIRCGVERPCSRFRSATHRMRRGSLGDAFGPGSPLISTLAGARSETAAIPIAYGRWRSLRAALARMAVRPVRRLGDRAGRNRRWGPCRWRELRHPAVLSNCVTRARASNPPGPPLRSGLAQEALGRAVKAADREDRGAIFRTKIRRLSAPTPPKSF